MLPKEFDEAPGKTIEKFVKEDGEKTWFRKVGDIKYKGWRIP